MNKLKTINIIIPYFGKFPNYFQFFLKSCEKNPSINWTLITDCNDYYCFPQNVRKIEMTFDDLRSIINSKFNFEIMLDQPYKLCDMKPAYGYIFEEYIVGYDYWGYGDLDLIYGNIRKFLTPHVLSFDKVFDLGHFSLIKNTSENNKLFMKSVRYESYYETVFQSKKIFNFDETFLDRININMIFREKEKTIYTQRCMADIYTKSSDFILDLGDGNKGNRDKSFFCWNKGNLFRYVDRKNHVVMEEYLYIHLQKRNMKVSRLVNIDDEYFKIIPNSIDLMEVPINEVTSSFNRIKRKHFNLHYIRLRFRNLKTKIKFFLMRI